MIKDITIYLDDILDAIGKINSYISGMNEVDFSRNSAIQDAVIRRLAIIGEAAGKIPKDIRENFRQIPWRQITGLRNVMIHEYASVSMGRVWKVIEKDLPKLYNDILNLKTSLVAK